MDNLTFEIAVKDSLSMELADGQVKSMTLEQDPGRQIDCWSGYTGLSALGYVHRTVNHSNNFVDPLSGVCTNQVEGHWSRLKQFLRRLGALQSSFLPEYID
nr:unnamed protein product [Callosobruchus analis]